MSIEYRTLNPFTEELVESYSLTTDAEVESAIASSSSGFADWRRRSIERRAELLLTTADLLEARAPSLAQTMALEMGKPLAQGEAEAKKCAWVCRYYAENGEAFLRPSSRESDGSEAYVSYEPIGPVLAIMPWNFPFWQFYRFAAPALVAGNTVFLKHAPNTPRSALEMIGLLHEAGVPTAVAQNLFLDNDQAARLIADSRLRGVTLTGSTRAGRQVAKVAGEHLKPTVLELGGSDPFIVLGDADVDEAARVGVASRCLNSGQSCIAAKRFIVEASVYDRFRDAFVAAMEAQVVDDPLREGVNIGPMARADLRDQLAEQVAQSVSAGANVLCGGKPPERPGFFYPATALDAIPDGSPAACEELFGPVASLFRVGDEKEALSLANQTPYGLGASLWTSDANHARRLVPDIEAGAVFVNGLVKSDPRLPFGGIKDSGIGRELGREGMIEFVNEKTVWVR